MSREQQFRSTYERGSVRVPGLPVLFDGVERYVIKNGGSCSIAIKAGDTITLIDEQGCQSAELAFFLPSGKSTVAPLESSQLNVAALSSKSATVLRSILQSNEPSAQRLKKALHASGFDISNAEALHLPAQASANSYYDFCITRDGLLIVSVALNVMAPNEQATTTPITLYIRRQNSSHAKAVVTAPEPLADPLQDLNILPGQAKAYQVKAGQYIQVLDVKGRECSDFQAIDLRALEKGRNAFIDPTSTRSMTALAYPTPGLFNKYWSAELQPLVEIVQDTCGRHDSFGLACTARYYEDLGYPGHVNCSDNINKSLAEYAVRPQQGWPAINFFFNTLLDQNNVITMDDPWSRPGDYVLLRALTDLLCVSTACPCDVDAANGWQPTDIQVRVYDQKEVFKRSIAIRKSPEAEPSMTVESPFHKQFSRFTSRFIEYNGYWLPAEMNNLGAIAEYWNCREKVAVMDLSALRKFEITGPDAEALLQVCMTRDVKKLSVGQVVYTAMCYEHGGMIDDGTIFRLGENNFRWVCGTEVSGDWLREQAELRNLQAWVRHSTDQLCNLAVQGPNAKELLSSLFWTAPNQTPIHELAWFRSSISRIKDYQGKPVVISRTGYTGELGYEIFCHPHDADAVFEAIWEEGQAWGIQAIGLQALDMLRIEAGLAFAGQEFCDQTDPFEAGIGFVVPLKSKQDDFIGREALARRKSSPSRVLVGLELVGGQVPCTGDCIRKGRAQVGEITSAIKSPVLGKVIALCRVDIIYSEIGTELEVGQLDGQQKRIPARVVRFPHFDPTKERVKGNY